MLFFLSRAIKNVWLNEAERKKYAIVLYIWSLFQAHMYLLNLLRAAACCMEDVPADFFLSLFFLLLSFLPP